jgi:hypothetical protein
MSRFQERCQAWRDAPETERSRSRPRFPPYFSLRDYGQFNPQRFMCAISFPWLDRTRNTVEWGVACNGCRYKPTRDEPIDLNATEEERVLYTQEQYLAHFANCTKAHELFFKEDLQTFATEERLLPLLQACLSYRRRSFMGNSRIGSIMDRPGSETTGV